MPVGRAPGGIEVTPDGTKVYVVNYASHTVSVIDTTTNRVTDTVKVGKYPTRVAIGPFIDSNMTNQSTSAASNATKDIGVEETNLSSSDEKNAIKLNNSNNNNYESDNDSSSSGNESSKNNSTPGFGLLSGLACLFGGWKFRKK